MKKRIFAFCVAMVLVLSVCVALPGCDGQERKLPGWVDGKKNLIFYVFDQVEYYNEIAQEFNSLEGNEDANVIIQKAASDYFGDLINSYVGAATPDIVFMQVGDILPFLNGKNILLEPLDEYLANSEVLTEEDLWPSNDGYRYNETTKTLDPAKNNKLYAIIKDFSPDFPLSYNRDAMIAATTAMGAQGATIRGKLESFMENGYPAEIPEGGSPADYTLTWSEYNALALAMKQAGYGSGVVLDGAPELQLLQWIEMNGEYLFTEDDTQCKDIRNTPAIRAAFDNFRVLQDGPDAATQWVNSTQPGYQLFKNSLTGSMPMSSMTASTYYGRWAYSQFEWDQNLDKIGYCAPPLPDDYTYDSENPNNYSAVGGAMSLAITSKCAHKDLAWKFIEFFMTTVQERDAETGFNISGNMTIAKEKFLSTEGKSEEYNKLNSFFYNLGMNSKTVRMNRYITQTTFKQILWQNFEQYFYKPASKTWDEVLDGIRRDLNNEIAKAIG